MIQLLTAAGAKSDVKNKAGRAPLEAAERAREPNRAVIALQPR